MDDCQSGFIVRVDPDEILGSTMTDVEVLRITGTNVIARGRRYGRLWLLKGIREELRGSTSAMRLLVKEFELHSRLDHHGVVRTVGFEEIDGLGTCIVEEWIEGQTLAEALRAGELTRRDRRRIIRQIIETVAYIHSRGVVHRDLKPANIMIRRTGIEAVIIDFGLADSDDYAEFKQGAGTPGFIAPEQIESGGAESADDIYSLGVIMRELSPELGSIADRCTAVRHRRPTADRLLRLIERRQRLPRVIGLTAGAVGIVSAILIATLTIKSLKSGAHEAMKTISALEAQNRRESERIARLTDSLADVSTQFAESERVRLETERYISAKTNAMEKGCAILDQILQRYDSQLYPKLHPGEYEPINSHEVKLLNELRAATGNYCQTLGAPLTQSDIRVIESDLTNYWALAHDKYLSKWLAKANPVTGLPTNE